MKVGPASAVTMISRMTSRPRPSASRFSRVKRRFIGRSIAYLSVAAIQIKRRPLFWWSAVLAITGSVCLVVVLFEVLAVADDDNLSAAYQDDHVFRLWMDIQLDDNHRPAFTGCTKIQDDGDGDVFAFALAREHEQVRSCNHTERKAFAAPTD